MSDCVPTPEQVDRRLRQMLAADSRQTGDAAHTDRLMLMLTRSCELRCAYCFVGLTEEAYGEDHPGVPTAGVPRGDMSAATARRAVDHLMSSPKPRLALQLFGGEPTRRWERVVQVLEYARSHPHLGGRALAIQLTTNGFGVDPERLAVLASAGVTVQLSVDGAGRANRFRRLHVGEQVEADRTWERTIHTLRSGTARWFLNATLPPAAFGELPLRWADAVALGVPAVQLNYTTGMAVSPAQFRAWCEGLAAVLRSARTGGPACFNRQAAADPAPLCGDVLCDVDGTLLQIGGIFHEARFPGLRAAYTHGHVATAPRWEGHRATLAELWRRTRAALAGDDLAVFVAGMRLGAASDLVARAVAAEAR